ncbi:MAG: tRNA 2-thiouridine(34) synthase MnmA [Acidimicrobiia bacterium]
MRRVMVAMSGGVDSSVAAALLSQAGYEVVGVTLKLWGGAGEFAETGCCTAADAADARRVASQLGIDYYVFDFVDPFTRAVVDPFVEAYSKGLTPNPCVECNRAIKFSMLLEKATHLGCDLLATGHHARVRHASRRSIEGECSQQRAESDYDTGTNADRYELLRGKDKFKDQSYVLYMLDQESLSKLLLPIGELTKAEVRSIAASLGLRTASKPESQDICFVGSRSVSEFVSERAGKSKYLTLVDQHGNDLGQTVLATLTVGQRRGLGVSLGSRMYVKKILPDKRIAVVAPKEDVYEKTITVTDFNWISASPPKSRISAEVQIRYNAPAVKASIVVTGESEVRVEFQQPVWAPAPGQIAVAYDGDEVLGGGVITEEHQESDIYLQS